MPEELKNLALGLFNGRSLLVLLVCLISATVLASLTSYVLRKLSHAIRLRSHVSQSRSTAARLRRIETWVVLSIAALKLIYYAIALYLWWVLTHEGKAQPTAIIGASAVIAIVIGGVVGPLLRDFAYGTSMMAEQWYAVGDLVTIEPFDNMRGVVDRITLRSTRISGLNGEVIWISNQSIAAVRVARKGVSTIAIELFVTDVDAATKLVNAVNNLLPTGSALVAQTLVISRVSERTDGIWHMTAMGETAPAREWILLETAIELLKKLDNPKKPIFAADPVARFADSETEERFKQAVSVAKKKHRKRVYRKLGNPRSTLVQSQNKTVK